MDNDLARALDHLARVGLISEHDRDQLGRLDELTDAEVSEARDRIVQTVRPIIADAGERSGEELERLQAFETVANHVAARRNRALFAPPPAAGRRASLEAIAAHRPDHHAPVRYGTGGGPRIVGRDGMTTYADLADVAHEVTRTLSEWQGSTFGRFGRRGSTPQRAVVASLHADFPPERRLGADAARNMGIIASATSPQAITAAGGLCAPVTTDYTILVIADARRPVRDALPHFQAERGGITYAPPVGLADIDLTIDASNPAAAVTVWSEATDANPGEKSKGVQAIECKPFATVTVDAIAYALSVGNFTARFYPELVQGWLETTIAAHARVAETRLLEQLDAASTAVTTGTRLGATRDLLAQVGFAVAGIRSRHRATDLPLMAVFPDWSRELFRTDLARQAESGIDRLAVSDDQIAHWFGVRGVTPVWSPDRQVLPTQTTGALDELPSTVEWNLLASGSFMFLDGGQLDLGLIRDSVLTRTNDAVMFAETFENIAPVSNHESLIVTSTVDPSGAAQAAIDATTPPSV